MKPENSVTNFKKYLTSYLLFVYLMLNKKALNEHLFYNLVMSITTVIQYIYTYSSTYANTGGFFCFKYEQFINFLSSVLRHEEDEKHNSYYANHPI